MHFQIPSVLNNINFQARGVPNKRSPEDKSLEIDTVSFNSLNAIKTIMIFDENSEKPVLGVTPGGYPLRQSFKSWLALSNNILRSEISLVVYFFDLIVPKIPKEDL